MTDSAVAALAEGFALASRAAARLAVMAAKAENAGQEGLAAFFRAAAASQEVAARRLLWLYRGKLPAAAGELAPASWPRPASWWIAWKPRPIGRRRPAARTLAQAARPPAPPAGAQAAAPPGLPVCTVCGHLAGAPPGALPGLRSHPRQVRGRLRRSAGEGNSLVPVGTNMPE